MIITTRAENTAQLHMLESPGGSLQQITKEIEPVRNAAFEPTNGNYFLFLKDTGGDEFTHIYKYDLTDKSIDALTQGQRIQNGFPVWSNRGDLIAYTSTRRNGADRDIYIMNPNDPSTDRLLIERKGGGWGVRDWSPDDKYLLISEFVSRIESHYYLLQIESGVLIELTDKHKGEAYFSQGEFDANGTGIFFITDLNSDFKRVAYMDFGTKEGGMGGLVPEELSVPELIKWNSFDGLEISGFCYKPPAKFTGKRPVIINIHGGPEGQSRHNFIGSSNYYINELGIAIIYPNVRGSTGYGKNFLELDNGKNRENSVKDIGALLDWIALQPDLDAERVMVTGGSYGGYMSLAVSVHYTDRIRCAVDVVGISNFQHISEKIRSRTELI
ncbi:MAG: S9 family peptidase [Ignavibacteria bacterium]|nr:S9 family peptidase [Ignavibacteria bacterium]